MIYCEDLAWWGSDLKHTTGQSIVTARVIEKISKECKLKSYCYYGKGLSSVFLCIMNSINLLSSAFANRIKTLYLVCSRSNGGFLRDLPAYIVSYLGVRVIVHVHGSDIVDLCKRPIIGKIATKLLRCELIVPSHHLVKPLQSLGINDILVCENFMEGLEDIIPKEQNKLTNSLPKVILWNSNILARDFFWSLQQ